MRAVTSSAKGKCSFCGLDNYLTEGMHSCCSIAQRIGEATCIGCDGFRKRWERGETCPHVTGVDKNGKAERGCCRP